MAWASSTPETSYTIVNWNVGNSQTYTATGTESYIFNATSSNPLDGGRYIFEVCQDTTGSRTVNWLGSLIFPNGTTTVSSSANTCTMLGMIYSARRANYIVVASTTNIAQN
jgi:hypothetical protein